MVAGRLPLVLDILISAEQSITRGNINEESCRAVKGVVEECKRKANELDEIFQEIRPKNGASRLERVTKRAKTTSKGYELGKLMQGILEDVQLLASRIEIADKTLIEQLSAAITEMAALASSDPKPTLQETETMTSYHFGSGTQHNAQGRFIAQGEARQYNSSGGTINFGKD